ncbi:MAG: hypothetical protein RL885_30145 [Planctomycetota bacterium]
MHALLAALLLTLSTIPRADEPAKAEYTVIVQDPASELVTVRLHLSGLAGPFELALADGWGFANPAETSLVRGPDLPEGIGYTLSSIEELGPRRWKVNRPPSTNEVDLSWTVKLDHRRQPEVQGRDEYEHPYLAEDHGMLVAGAIFLTPSDDDLELETRVRFELPEGWAVHAPWPEIEPGVFAPSEQALTNDLIAIGHWDVIEKRLDGLDLTIAFAPGQDALRDIVSKRVPPILEAEVKLFAGAPQPKYLFVFGRCDQPSSYGGSPKTASMTLYVAPDLPLDFVTDGVTHLIAHEYHHTFMMANCQPKDELRFVMEGFTDWAAHTVPWRLGFTSDADMKQSLEKQIAKGARSLKHFGGTLLDAGGPKFFEGGHAYSACYAAGLMLAAWLDVALRDRDREDGVDGFIRRLWKNPEWSEEQRPALDDFLNLVEKLLDEEARNRLRAYLETPGGGDPAALFKTLDVELNSGQVPLDPSPRANFQGTTVMVLDPEGAGAVIGLEHGDQILEVNGVEVSGAGEIQSAWRNPIDGRLKVRLIRGGDEQQIDVPIPTRLAYSLPDGFLDRIR